jgi:predicted DNA-binding antitoxin AbrB/MazE fold protein
MKVVQAVFENGVFRPRERVELPEGSEVEFEPRLVPAATPKSHRERVHALLSQTIETGETDLAERHDEPLS